MGTHMAKWHNLIDLNQAIVDASTKYNLTRVEDACPQEVKDMLCTEINKNIHLAQFTKRLQACVAITEVNRLLDEIFDVADAKGIWCGS